MAFDNQTNLGIGDDRDIQEWLSGVTYQPNEEVSNAFNVYIALVCHISGDFATDLAAGKWVLVGGAGGIETDPVFTASPAFNITSTMIVGLSNSTTPSVSNPYATIDDLTTTFIGLTDTPIAYSSGHANRFVRVNASFDALTFVAGSSINVSEFNNDAGYETENIYTANGTASSRTVSILATQFILDGTAGNFIFNGSSGNSTFNGTHTVQKVEAASGSGNGYRFSGFVDHNIHMGSTGQMFMTVDGNDLFRLHNVGGFRGVSVNTGGAIPTATVDAQSGDNLSTSRILRARNFAGLDAFAVYGNGRIGINTSLAPTDLVMIDAAGVNNRGLTVKNGTDIAAAIGYSTAKLGGGYLSLRDEANAERVLIQGSDSAGSAVFGVNDTDYTFGVNTGLTPTAPFDIRTSSSLFRSVSASYTMTLRGTGSGINLNLDANGGAGSDTILSWQKAGVNKYSAKYDAGVDAFYLATGLAGNTGLSIDASNNIGLGGVNANGSKLEVVGDAEVRGSANGYILQSPDNTRWRVTIDNAGALTTTSL